MKTPDELRAALKRFRRGEQVMHVPPDPENDDDAIVADAIDELEQLRTAQSASESVREAANENARLAIELRAQNEDLKAKVEYFKANTYDDVVRGLKAQIERDNENLKRWVENVEGLQKENGELKAYRDSLVGWVSMPVSERDALFAQVAENERLREELQKKSCCKGCPDCIGIGMAAELRALRDAMRVKDEALRTIADMSCGDHDDDEHEPDCGVTIARAALEVKP